MCSFIAQWLLVALLLGSTVIEPGHPSLLVLWTRFPSFSWTPCCVPSRLLLSGFPLLLYIGPGPHTCLASSVPLSDIQVSVFDNYSVSLSSTHWHFLGFGLGFCPPPELSFIVSASSLECLCRELGFVALAWGCSLCRLT